MTFAQQMEQICSEHRITCLAINFFPGKPEIAAYWYAYAHDEDALGSSGGAPTAEAAIAGALSDLEVRRGRPGPVPVMSALELAS